MKRENNRKADELRQVFIKAGVIPNANGSAIVKLGKTIAVAAVYGPKEMFPKHKKIFKRRDSNFIKHSLFFRLDRIYYCSNGCIHFHCHRH